MEETATIRFNSDSTWDLNEYKLEHHIVIDGVIVETLKQRETKVVQVSPGKHVIQILNRDSSRFIEVIEITSGENKVIELLIPSRTKDFMIRLSVGLFIIPMFSKLISIYGQFYLDIIKNIWIFGCLGNWFFLILLFIPIYILIADTQKFGFFDRKIYYKNKKENNKGKKENNLAFGK